MADDDDVFHRALVAARTELAEKLLEQEALDKRVLALRRVVFTLSAQLSIPWEPDKCEKVDRRRVFFKQSKRQQATHAVDPVPLIVAPGPRASEDS